jgi:hypothetical protein
MRIFLKNKYFLSDLSSILISLDTFEFKIRQLLSSYPHDSVMHSELEKTLL